ncbi:MAG: flagellar biosynthesis repressor FlbT [Parvularculaceae bacterium]|nr:flagellar biosynthesis repressor FlbT [Parvularculaceae bacterium]
MTGLVLKLKPHEKFLINGAVLQNGDRAARLRIRTAGASVLRLRDAMHPNDAVTPLRKIYYIAQLAIAGEVDEAAARAEMLEGLRLLRADASAEVALASLEVAEQALRDGKLFAAMRALKKAIPLDGSVPTEKALCSSRQSQ